MTELPQFDPLETASRDELEGVQLRRLQSSLSHAYENTAFYRQHFEAHGVHPDDLRTLSDLDKFPFTTKEDLRAHYPYGLCAVPKARLARVHASSGTTGKPTVVAYSKADLAVWSGLVARSLRAARVSARDMVQNAFGYGLFTGGLGLHQGAERLGCAVLPVSGGMTERQVTLLQDLRADVIMATPSYMLTILDEFRRQGRDPRDCALHTGIFGAEPWSEAVRQEVEAAFGIAALDIYGLSEIMGPGVAQECADARGSLHIWEDHILPEIIDPSTGATLDTGAHGELVLTTLTKEALPMIRYRTRDMTRLHSGQGRVMRRMERIVDRSDDMIILRGVNLFPSQIEELLYKCPALASRFQLELTREGRMDVLTIHCEARPGHCSDQARQQAACALRHHVKSVIGLSVQVRIHPPEHLACWQGKAQKVIDRRIP